MLEIVSTPLKAIGNTGFNSTWVCTDAPVEFKVQRKDNLIASTVADAGYCKITLAASPNSLFYLSQGESIILHNSITKANTIATVTTKTSDTVYTLSIPYASQQFDYYVAYQKVVNYFFEVKLTINDVALPNLAKFTPALNGLAICDVSGYLYSQVSDNKLGDYSANNIAEKFQSGKFLFSIRENYIGSTNFNFTTNSTEWHYIKGTRSIEKGCNVSEFVPNLAQPAKFLNYFDRQTYFKGLPFDLSFIYSELLAGKPIQLRETHYDRANSVISQQIKNIDSSGVGYVNSIRVSQESIEPTCSYIKFEVLTDDATPPVVENTWYIITSPFTPSEPLKFVKTDANVAVTGTMPENKLGGNVALPNVTLTPSANVPININYNTSFFANMYRESPRNFWELGISASEFAKFTSTTRLFVMIATRYGYDVGFVDLDPATLTTKVAFMNAIKSALDSAASGINSIVGYTCVQTMNSNEEDRARTRAYLATAYNHEFISVAYWYYGQFKFDVYPGPQTAYDVYTDTGKTMYNVTQQLEYGLIKTNGTVDFVTYNNLGCDIRVVLPTTTYTV